jgi:hypothetical protein
MCFFQDEISLQMLHDCVILTTFVDRFAHSKQSSNPPSIIPHDAPQPVPLQSQAMTLPQKRRTLPGGPSSGMAHIKHGRRGMTARHHPAKAAQATPCACTTETVMLPSDAASLRPVGLRARGRLKNGSCEPKHWEVRRKRIADGPKGVASRARARQTMTLPFSRILPFPLNKQTP